LIISNEGGVSSLISLCCASEAVNAGSTACDLHVIKRYPA
jgi:hypothetical protein